MSLTERPVLQLSFIPGPPSPTGSPRSWTHLQISQSVRILLQNWLASALEARPLATRGPAGSGRMVGVGWAQGGGGIRGILQVAGLRGTREMDGIKRGDPNRLSLKLAIAARPQALHKPRSAPLPETGTELAPR